MGTGPAEPSWPCGVSRMSDRRITAALAICEQGTKHRTAAYGLDYLNGYSDALDIVEQALRGES